MRYCPALAKKPIGVPQTGNDRDKKPKTDPFENPSPELLVTEFPKSSPSYVVVLNKYPIIQNHFILATKTSKPQTDLLEENDLGVAYACLKAWSPDSKTKSLGQLFAFFNSGEHSGASQAHRHLQFLPVEDMRASATDDWTLLIDQEVSRSGSGAPIYQNTLLPFVHFATDIEDEVTPKELHNRYVSLLEASVKAIRGRSDHDGTARSLLYAENNEPVISYNLAMTLNRMSICPRRNGTVTLPMADTENSISVNGTILGGTLMVKNEQEWKALRKDAGLLDHVLKTIGFPATNDDEVKQ